MPTDYTKFATRQLIETAKIHAAAFGAKGLENLEALLAELARRLGVYAGLDDLNQ